MYLDDMSVNGSFEDVLHDLDVIKEADSLGLYIEHFQMSDHLLG